MNDFGGNVKLLLNKKGISPADLARALDTSPQNVNSMLSQKKPRLDTVQNIASAIGVEVQDIITPDRVVIPYYEIDVMAGGGQLFSDQSETPTMYISFPGFNDCDFACRVSGDSMEDKIHAGDIIACKEISDRNIFAFGDDHLIITNEHRFIKTLRKGTLRGEIILRSYNKEYDDIDIKIDDIKKLYLIKGIIKKTQI